MKNLFILFYLLIASSFAVFSQVDSLKGEIKIPYRYIEVKGHTGAHLYSHESLSDEVQFGYGSVEVRYGWQPHQEENWVSKFGYASYGVGVYSGFIGDPKVFGNPNAIFGFVNFPISKPGKKNTFQISPALGLTYNLEPYDGESNPNQDALGAKMAVYFNVNFGWQYVLNRQLDLLYGIDYTHFSNGRTYTPNHGLDMLGINLGLRMYHNKDQKLVDPDPYTNNVLPARFMRNTGLRHEKSGESALNFYVAVGTSQNEEDKGTSNRYSNFSGVIDYQYKFNTMSAITAGFDLFYDEGLISYEDKKDRIFYGIHAGYDFMFYDFTLRVQVGTYLGDDKGKDNVFIRPTLQYKITDWMYAQAGLKTRNGARADWIEWGIGFNPFKW